MCAILALWKKTVLGLIFQIQEEVDTMASKRDTLASDLKKAISAENSKISEQVETQTNNITALTSSIESLKGK